MTQNIHSGTFPTELKKKKQKTKNEKHLCESLYLDVHKSIIHNIPQIETAKID